MADPAHSRWGDADDLLRQIDVQPLRDGVWTAPLHHGASRNVIEGGQLLAQSCMAAARLVPDKRVISAHVSFARPARFDLPLEVHARELRSGRQFSNLEVNTVQEGKLQSLGLLLMDKGGRSIYTHQPQMPDVPGPETAEEYDFGMPGRDLRFIGGTYQSQTTCAGEPVHHCWVRWHGVRDDAALHNAIMAQPTTHFTINASMRPHGVIEAESHFTFSTGVMDIAIQFHEDADVNGWILYENPAFYAGRGLVAGRGNVFSQAGKLLASYQVQAMVREFEDTPGRERDPSRVM
jgi:acyl-CoA thioesterase II